MRRFGFLSLVLWVGLGVAAFSQGLANQSDTTKQERMAIRAAANKLISSGNPDDVAKGTALLEKANELEQQESNAEKLALDREKLKRDLDDAEHNHWRDALVSFIPLASTIILAATLIFQISKDREERKEKRAEQVVEAKQKEQQRYMDTLKEIQTSEKISTAAALINTFNDEPFRTQARDLAVTLLLMRKNFDDFEAMYMAVMNPLTYDKMPQMWRLCKAVDGAYFTIATPIWNDSTASSDVSKLKEKDHKLFDLYSQEQVFLSNKLAELLHIAPPPGVKVDLSQLNLRNIDLSGVDLGDANIAATNWNFVNVDGCDMSKVTEFENCWMWTTAWWHAAKISQPLLQRLTEHCPYSPTDRYNTKSPVGPEEYRDCLAKLAAGGSDSATGRARADGIEGGRA